MTKRLFSDAPRFPGSVQTRCVLCLMLPWVLSTGNTVWADDEPVRLCIVQDQRINECSGLAVSRSVAGAFWMHNDSGDTARLFLVGSDGHTQVVLTLARQKPYDWEDMCSFRFQERNWLLIADTGDNAHERARTLPECCLLLVAEPDADEIRRAAAGRKKELSAKVFATIRFEYPEGPQDCESVAVDPVHQEILLLTKSSPLNCRLYRLPLQTDKGDHHLTAEPVAAPALPFATAMDISMDGRQMVIVSPFGGVQIHREAETAWADAFISGVRPLSVPVRRQGETVCFSADGLSVFVNSEFPAQPLWQIAVANP